MTSQKALIRVAREELHYWQMRVRMDIKSLMRTIERTKEAGARLRKLQQEERTKKHAVPNDRGR